MLTCNICYIFRKITATFVIAAAFLMVFASCNDRKQPKFRIGVSQCSKDEWRDKMNEEMQREMLFHPESQLEILSVKDDNEAQIADIQSFIDRKFDIIIVAPNEAEAFTPIIKKAYESGIPVIIFDRRIKGDYYTSYINLDNEGIGYAAAEYANSLSAGRPSRIIEVTGLSESSPAQERHAGFIKGLQNYPSLSLVKSFAADWEREKAYLLMDSLLNVYPDVDIIYAHNDFMALGIDSLLREKGRRDIKVLGTDASPGQGIPAVKEGKIDATFIYPTEGHRIIRTAFSILEGDPYDTVVDIPALTSVDKSNADILLRQHELLNDETQKVLLLNDKNDQLWIRYKEQSAFLYTVIGFSIAVLVVLVILVLILRKNILLQRELRQKNDALIEERDRQIALYSKLDSVLQEEKNMESEFYTHFISIIKSKYNDPNLNTEAMASEMNLGATQLTRRIKALTNFTPVEILRNYRMEQARNLLLSTSMNINEITFAVGFSSPAYLSKCFREHFGLTPSDLRAKNS